MTHKHFSIIIPFKDEAENVLPLLKEVNDAVTLLGKPFEILAIEDGSLDNTREILIDAKKIYPSLKVIVFSKNFGQTAAFDAGFKAAKGDIVITLDGDLQNDPKDIAKLLHVMEKEDADLVCGWRKSRKDPWSKKIISKIAGKARFLLFKDVVKDSGCSLKVYNRKALSQITLFDGMHRFLPILFSIHGFKVKEAAVHHRERTKGKTKYNFFNRSFNTIYDLLAVYWIKKRLLKYKISHEV